MSSPTIHISASVRTLLFVVAINAMPLVQAQTYTVLYQFRAGGHGTQPAAGVTLDTKRNSLYGTTSQDGGFAAGTVYKLSKSGETVLHSFTGSGGDGEYPYANGPLVMDAAGNLYGTTVSGGIYGGNCGNNGCGVVFKVTQSGEETVLYEFQGGGDGGYPQGSLAIDPSGTLYGSASSFGGFGAGVVYKVDQTGNESTLYTFNPSNYGDGGVPIGGVVRDSAGNLFGTTLYGGNLGEGTLFKIDSAGVETILYSFGAYFGDALLPYAGVSLDSKGNAYGIAYGGAQGYGAIYEVSPSGTDAVLYSFGPPPDGQPSYIGDNVVLDKKGNLYGVTSGGGTFGFGIVYKIDSTGKETILHNFGGPDGKNPIGSLVFDPKGNLYGTTSEGGAHGGGVIFRITP